MIAEGNKVEMEIFNSIFIEYALALDKLAEVQVVEKACLSEGEELPVIKGALVSLDAHHARLAHVQRLLVGGAKTVAEALCVLEEQVSSLLVVEIVGADRAGCQGVESCLCVHIIDVVLLGAKSLLGKRVETVGCI